MAVLGWWVLESVNFLKIVSTYNRTQVGAGKTTPQCDIIPLCMDRVSIWVELPTA